MATKMELIEQLKAKGIDADASMHPATLKKMLEEAGGGTVNSNGGDGLPPIGEGAPTPGVMAKDPNKEGYMKISDVKALIAEALAQQKQDANTPIKIKRVTQHTAHVWRFDSKWVVDFKDRNTDPYHKEKVHAYQKFNEQLRQFEAWVELVFEDGTTKDIPLTTYVKNRVLVYCPIIERMKIDRSYSMGEVEKKKEVGDKYVGTGVLIDQEVTRYDEVFKIKTPEGTILELPDYVIA